MRTADLDFHLPPKLIAQEPAARRPDARMLHYIRTTGEIAHRHVRDLPHILTPRDLLLFNGTSVIPAKFTVRKPTGGLVEGLWLETEPHWPFLRGRVLLKG
ncbi:MAG: S-adenosylmethionine:tRNA ribosyltransferase-isomerase, partial [Planctomycetota bacterium]